MTQKCTQCEWWARKDRPNETFVFVSWEWDVDRARGKEPVEQGEVPTADVAGVVDYPRESNSIRIFRVHVDEHHLDHVDMTRPILFGLLRTEGKVSGICIDGHHRIARAVRDGLPALKYVLISEEDLLDCAFAGPSWWKPKKRKKG